MFELHARPSIAYRYELRKILPKHTLMIRHITPHLPILTPTNQPPALDNTIIGQSLSPTDAANHAAKYVASRDGRKANIRCAQGKTLVHSLSLIAVSLADHSLHNIIATLLVAHHGIIDC
jgi:hypothetical protein